MDNGHSTELHHQSQSLSPPLFTGLTEARFMQSLTAMFDALDDELQEITKPLSELDGDERRVLGSEEAAAQLGQAWEANSHALHALLPRDPIAVVALPAPGDDANSTSHLAPSDSVTSLPYGTGGQVLAHLARDWSDAGATARRKAHRPVLRLVSRLAPSRILVPGAGACRLAWEMAAMGHRVEANDASVHMLLAARSLMVWRESPLRLFPWVRCAAGVLRRSACLAAAVAPDVGVKSVPHLTLQAGDFMAMYSPERWPAQLASWDCIVTCYFLDTLVDAPAVVRRIVALLAPGGRWINFGPLHWHEPAAGLLRLTYEELLALLRLRGLHLEVSRGVRAVPYLEPSRSGVLASSANSWHDCLFFVARKREEHLEPAEPHGDAYNWTSTPGSKR